MLPFRRGFERIMKDVDAPIIPVALDGVWGSIFSFEKGRFSWKVPAAHPLSGHGQLRQTAAAHRHAVRSAAGRAGTHGGGVESTARAACSRCIARSSARRAASASVSRWPMPDTAEVHFRLPALDTHDLPRPAAEETAWEGQEMVGLAPAAVGAGRAGQFRRAADWAKCR